MDKKGTQLGDPCPACGEYSYQGGYCLNRKCGKYRASKHNKRKQEQDTVDFMQSTFGRQVDTFLTESAPRGWDDEDEDILRPHDDQ